MKTAHVARKESQPRQRIARIISIIALTALWIMPCTAYGDIYVGLSTDQKVLRYGLDGTLINGSLITGVNPLGLTVAGDYLYVADGLNNSIGKYNLDGTPVNTSFITGLSEPWDVEVAGGYIFVSNYNRANYGSAYIGKYNLDGTPINTSFIGGLPIVMRLAVSGGKLFATTGDTVNRYNFDGSAGSIIIEGFDHGSSIDTAGDDLFLVKAAASTIAKYTTSGAPVNTSLITGLGGPIDIKATNGNLYVVENGAGKVSVYNLDGTTVNSSFITGVTDPVSIAVDTRLVPEPSTCALTLIGAMSVWLRHRRR